MGNNKEPDNVNNIINKIISLNTDDVRNKFLIADNLDKLFEVTKPVGGEKLYKKYVKNLPFGESVAMKFRRINKCEWLKNLAFDDKVVSNLPNSYNTLYGLTKDEYQTEDTIRKFEKVFRDGWIPKMVNNKSKTVKSSLLTLDDILKDVGVKKDTTTNDNAETVKVTLELNTNLFKSKGTPKSWSEASSRYDTFVNFLCFLCKNSSEIDISKKDDVYQTEGFPMINFDNLTDKDVTNLVNMMKFVSQNLVDVDTSKFTKLKSSAKFLNEEGQKEVMMGYNKYQEEQKQVA